MTEQIHYTFIITEELAGKRIDLALSYLLPDYSRSLIQKWINSQQVLLNKKQTKTRAILQINDHIDIQATLVSTNEYEPNDISLNIKYEDSHLVVINKPANLVVHPGAGNYTGTILNGLLYKYPNSKFIPRAGIVHRLDKDTTGLMVVAKDISTYHKLVEEIKYRKVTRIYQAICYGQIKIPGKITSPIGRHPNNRIKMCVNPNGKPAETYFRPMTIWNNFTHLELQLITGRTHQIRVHLADIKHAIVGDKTYNNNKPLLKNTEINTTISMLDRQALHAKRLSFKHPITDQEMSFEETLPKDIQQLIEAIEKYDS
jgi:23S rRNA pseudouridine1911/1915/1917 synthase